MPINFILLAVVSHEHLKKEDEEKKLWKASTNAIQQVVRAKCWHCDGVHVTIT